MLLTERWKGARDAGRAEIVLEDVEHAIGG
jgi:hypothetical protein